MGLVDDLIANAGTYIGVDTVHGTEHRGAARIVVTALPGNAGVSLEYEIFNATFPDRVRGHVEHTFIGRIADGSTIMLIGHTHSESLTLLRETSPGVFDPASDAEPYPMKVELSVPAPGKLRHVWWYGDPLSPKDETLADLAP